MSDKIYNHTEMTEITQYNVEDVYKDGSDTELAFGKPKRYVPVFHWLQPVPWVDPIEYHEWYVEIGWPTDTPIDTEIFDEEVLAYSGLERDVHPDAIFVSPTTATLKLKQPKVDTIQLSATVTPSTSEFPVTWGTSSDKVTVSDKWLVTPVAAGEGIEVTATSWAVSAFAVITVEKVAVTWVTLNKDEVTLAPAATEQLTATVSPNDAYVNTVTWWSSDEAVATVDNWLITAVAAGTATITVTSTDDNTKTATCTVTVEEPAPVEDTPTEPGE